MLKNPYLPGRITTNVVGRSKQIDAARQELAYIKEFPEFNGTFHVTTGPRGVGKTSLLRLIQQVASDLGYETVWVTAGNEPIFRQLVSQFTTLAENWKDQAKSAFRKLLANTSVSLLGVEISGGKGQAPHAHQIPSAPERELQDLLVKVCDQVTKSEKKPGLVIFIDEIQETDAKSLRTLCYTWQHMQAETPEVPILLYTAGLTHTPDVITDAASFGERFTYQAISNLNPEDTVQALRLPAEKQSVAWEDTALRRAADLTRGYPYFVQLIGYTTWEAAGIAASGDSLTESALQAGLENFVTQRNEMFRSRWAKASDKERELLAAMAALGDAPQRRADIAAQMGVESTDISMVRSSLIDKGLIEPNGYGYLGFSVPGFAAWVLSSS